MAIVLKSKYFSRLGYLYQRAFFSWKLLYQSSSNAQSQYSNSKLYESTKHKSKQAGSSIDATQYVDSRIKHNYVLTITKKTTTVWNRWSQNQIYYTTLVSKYWIMLYNNYTYSYYFYKINIGLGNWELIFIT